MTSTKHRLGEFIEQLDGRNTDGKYKINDVRGISTSKEFIATKADMNGVSLTSYKVVGAGEFAFVPDTSRRGDKMSLAYNNSSLSYIVSSISCVFKVNNQEKLLPDYLYIYFNRPEFDRYARFNSWGSARETFAWEDMCDIEIDLPPIEIQKKYVDIYNAMIANQACYERGLEDLKLTCEAYIEELRRKTPCEEIGQYIEEIDLKNYDEKIKNAVGVSVNGVFDSARTSNKDSIKGCKVINENNLFWATQTTCGIGIGAVDIYRRKEPAICAPTCCVIKTKTGLNVNYLLMWLKRKEFARYTRFYGSGVVEKFGIDLMNEVKIPIPNIEIQNSIANIYSVYVDRKDINEKLKMQIKNICPILIKGSLEEANK